MSKELDVEASRHSTPPIGPTVPLDPQALDEGPEAFVPRPYPPRDPSASPLRGRHALVLDRVVERGRALAATLGAAGCAARHHAGGAELGDVLARERWEVILVSGADAVRADIEALAAQPTRPALICHGTPAQARDLGLDALAPDADAGETLRVIGQALERRSLEDENRRLRERLAERFAFGAVVTRDPALRDVLRTLEAVADTRATVLLTGETGTGKSMLARAVHAGSGRRDGPFVEVNCGALPSGILEAELFGHAKGAFTGADGNRAGRFEVADGGSIFLDEIDSAPPELQVKLLRVLQERQFERVGETRTRSTDVRVIAATNAKLKERVADGSFREDLYWRLNVVAVRVPALRERPRDLVPLVHHFVERFATEYGKAVRGVTAEALSTLVAHTWPGNVRQLEHAIERAVLLARGTELTPDDLGSEVAGAAPATAAPSVDVGLTWLGAATRLPSLRAALEEPGAAHPRPRARADGRSPRPGRSDAGDQPLDPLQQDAKVRSPRAHVRGRRGLRSPKFAMKWKTTTALILAAGAGALGLNRLFTPDTLDPRALLVQLERDARSGARDQGEALRRLTQAIEAKGSQRDPDLAADLYLARAAIYRGVGAFGPAREDLELVRNTWRQDDLDIELQISELMAQEGQVEQALLKVRRLVSREEVGPGAYELLGRLESEVSRGYLDVALVACKNQLDAAGAQRAVAILTEATARGANDPRTLELWSELRQVFRPHESAPVTEVLDAAVRASESASAAVAAYARAAELRPTVDAITHVVGVLSKVSRGEDAADLILASRAVEDFTRSPEIVSAALPVLRQTGRVARARSIVDAWDWTRGGDLDFYRSSAEILYRANLLNGVARTAQGMKAIGGSLGLYWWRFFSAAVTVGNYENALKNNPEFVMNELALEDMRRNIMAFARNQNELEPFVGARAEAWFILARGQKLWGHEDAERIALATGLPLASALPTDPSADRNAWAGADQWARLAELESRTTSPAWERIEQRYARAIDAEPTRTWEFVDRWVEAGNRNLEVAGLDYQTLLEEIRRTTDGLPIRSVGSSVYWRLAQAHVDEGRSYEGMKLAETLLKQFPRLVPALDTLIEAQLAYAVPSEVLRSILRRLELVGADATSDKYLSSLRAGLDGPDLLRAISAAPARFARPAAAELARANGDTARAADLLESVPAVEYSPDLRLMRAELRLAAQRYASAGTDFEVLLDDPRLGTRALLGLLTTRLAQDDRTGSDELTRRALDRPMDYESRMKLLQALLESPRVDLAGRVIELLDQSVDSRTPEFYAQLVRYAMRTGDPGVVREAIARAEPYVADGTPELAELLLLIEERNWIRLPEAVARLRARGLATTPLQETCITLLEERLTQGRRLAERSLAAEPRSPEWALVLAAGLALEGEPIELSPWFGARAVEETTETLLGSRRGRRDPRELLAVLLVLERSEWSPWIDQELRALNEQRAGTLWPQWLTARLHEQRGHFAEATPIAASICLAFKDFGPAWDMRLARVRAEHLDDPLAPDLLQLRVARLGALGPRVIEDVVEIALARASAELLKGSEELAIRALGEPLTRERRVDFEPQLTLGALLVRAGQYGLAVKPLMEAARGAPAESAPYVVDMLVDTLEHAANPDFERRARLTDEDLQARLNELIEIFPSDPIAALALVRHGPSGRGALVQQAALARAQLTRLRRVSGQSSLEGMRRGSAKPWVDLLIDLSPELAREIVTSEQASRPGDAGLWELLGRVSESVGDDVAAQRAYETAFDIMPSAPLAFALAAVEIRLDRPINDVQKRLASGNRLLRSAATAQSHQLTASLQSRLPFPNFVFITDKLKLIWERREQPDGTVRIDRAGLALASAYLQWIADLEREAATRSKMDAAAAAELPPQPTRTALAQEALTVLDELAPIVKGQPHSEALASCLRGIARRALQDEEAAARAPNQ
ncbi:MAG: sigma 54-interacting transcriptional regulator [Planctomycetota bacterium]